MAIYLWAVAFTLMVIYAIVWYALNDAVTAFITTVTSEFSSSFDQRFTNLFLALWQYSPALMLMGLLIWIYVNSQKPKEVMMEYA